MERVSRAIEAEPGLSRRALRTAVSGNHAAKDLALELLAAEGHVEQRHEGPAVRHFSTRPYRADDDPERVSVPNPLNGSIVPTVPTVPKPCPDRAQGAVEGDRAHRAPVPTKHGARGHASTGGSTELPVPTATDEEQDAFDRALSLIEGGQAA